MLSSLEKPDFEQKYVRLRGALNRWLRLQPAIIKLLAIEGAIGVRSKMLVWCVIAGMLTAFIGKSFLQAVGDYTPHSLLVLRLSALLLCIAAIAARVVIHKLILRTSNRLLCERFRVWRFLKSTHKRVERIRSECLGIGQSNAELPGVITDLVRPPDLAIACTIVQVIKDSGRLAGEVQVLWNEIEGTADDRESEAIAFLMFCEEVDQARAVATIADQEFVLHAYPKAVAVAAIDLVGSASVAAGRRITLRIEARRLGLPTEVVP